MFHVEHFPSAAMENFRKEYEMKRKLLLPTLLILALTGCRKENPTPEAVDPVYQDFKREAIRAFSSYKEKEKAAKEAKEAFDKAPIRTGQRLDAQESYFVALHEQETAAQNYRYYSIKADLRKKHDRIVYHQYFVDKKPWPDATQTEEYFVEKRLTSAPKEWSPQARIEAREKERQVASQPKNKGESGSEHE
jgi:hypothetical protein